MSKIMIPLGVADHVVPIRVGKSEALYETNSFQIAAKTGSGTMTVKAKATGCSDFEDIVDAENNVIGSVDFDNPKLLRVLHCSVESLQLDTTGISSTAPNGMAEIEIQEL